MQIVAFRIQNFKSIADLGWCKLSSDGVTGLIGQNESGKTSILEALSKTLSSEAIIPDDFRIAAGVPEISLRLHVCWEDIAHNFTDVDNRYAEAVQKYLKLKDGLVELEFFWEADQKRPTKYHKSYMFHAEEFENELSAISELIAAEATIENAPAESAPTPSPEAAPPSPAVPPSEPPLTVRVEDITEFLFDAAPTITLFRHDVGLLPNSIDIDDNNNLIGDGITAARNFLNVANIDLSLLKRSSGGTRETILQRANDSISRDFNQFWSQTIGGGNTLSLKCSLQTHESSAGEKAGKFFLAFFISDGLNSLHPKQRSQGVRWFISFYLQLRASQKEKDRHLFLLDEPGANLHLRAQGDVLKLINKLSESIPIIYSTHSPKMIEYEKLYRYLAVQRSEAIDYNPTEVIEASKLASASKDTLSPILMVMGADFSSQEVIKKSNNILLEEMSGHYYLKSFWHLMNRKEEAHFIAATGVGNTPVYANLFVGWGLKFIVAVDDDNHGRQTLAKIKKDIFGDDEAEAEKYLLKFKGFTGIEDCFSKEDFYSHVLQEDKIDGKPDKNTEYIKEKNLSKPVLAYKFAIKVREGEIKWEQLNSITKKNVTKIVEDLVAKLKNL